MNYTDNPDSDRPSSSIFAEARMRRLAKKASPNRHHRKARLMASAPKMRAALEQCAEYLDNRADISDVIDEDGLPRPNEAMRLLTEIREALQ